MPCKLCGPLLKNQNEEMKRASRVHQLRHSGAVATVLSVVLKALEDERNRPAWTAALSEVSLSEAPSSLLTLSLIPSQPCPLRSSSFLKTKRCARESLWSCLVKWQAPSPSPVLGWSSESRSVMEGNSPPNPWVGRDEKCRLTEAAWLLIGWGLRNGRVPSPTCHHPPNLSS